MAQKNLVTQGELKATIAGLDALANNLDEHVNQSLSEAHGWSILDAPYLDSGGLYHTDFGQSGLVPIPGVFNTGVNGDGTLSAPGSVDAHWVLIQSADPSFPGPSAFLTSPIPTSIHWSTNGPLSQWISPRADGSKNVKNGSYKYRLTFNLSGLNPASAVLKGSWVSDDKTITVLLNGIVTGLTGPSNHSSQPGAGTAFLLSSGFVAGTNTLDFIVTNNGGPCGLRVELTGLASAGGVFAVPGFFATGVNNSNVVVPLGSNEAHWTLAQSADPSNPGPTPFVMTHLGGGYAPNTSKSLWIGPRKQGNVPAGTYVYRLTFDLTGFNPNTCIIKGQFWSNDRTHDVLINGVSLGIVNSNTGKTYPTSFVITTGFQAGSNTLDFKIINDNSQDSGFRAEISATASNSGSGLTARVLRFNIGSNVFFVPAQLSGGLDGEPDATITPFTGIVSPQSADPASDLTVGSPTSAELITTFAALLNATSVAASNTLLEHAGSPAESVHSGLSWQPDSVVTSAGFLVGRRTINILIDGVQYKIVGDTNINGPIN